MFEVNIEIQNKILKKAKHQNPDYDIKFCQGLSSIEDSLIVIGDNLIFMYQLKHVVAVTSIKLKNDEK